MYVICIQCNSLELGCDILPLLFWLSACVNSNSRILLDADISPRLCRECVIEIYPKPLDADIHAAVVLGQHVRHPDFSQIIGIWMLMFSPSLSWLSLYVIQTYRVRLDTDIIGSGCTSFQFLTYHRTLILLPRLSWFRLYVLQISYVQLDTDILATVLTQRVRDQDLSHSIGR